MPSTYTTRTRLEKQAPGENLNTWGALLNANTIDMVDQAVAGVASYALSGPKTLTSNNGASDEARCLYQNITGGTGGTVTIPNAEKTYIVRNGSTGTVTFTTGSGTACEIFAGAMGIVGCEGGNICRNLLGHNGVQFAAPSPTVPNVRYTNPTRNWISFGAVGTDVPTAGGNRGVGTKIVLYDGGNVNDYALGVGGGYLWSQAPGGFSWCAGNPTYVLTMARLVSGEFRLLATSVNAAHLWVTNDNAGFTDYGLHLQANPGAGLDDNYASFGINNALRVILHTSEWMPAADNGMHLGLGSNRWNTVFATNGTINTSDERDKDWGGAAGEDALGAAGEIIDELGFFRWKKGGADQRQHFGIRAQRIERILARVGVKDSGMVVRSTWDENPAGPAAPQPAGERYGTSYTELAMFLIAAQARQIRALEARLAQAGL